MLYRHSLSLDQNKLLILDLVDEKHLVKFSDSDIFDIHRVGSLVTLCHGDQNETSYTAPGSIDTGSTEKVLPPFA